MSRRLLPNASDPDVLPGKPDPQGANPIEQQGLGHRLLTGVFLIYRQRPNLTQMVLDGQQDASYEHADHDQLGVHTLGTKCLPYLPLDLCRDRHRSCKSIRSSDRRVTGHRHPAALIDFDV